MDTLDNLVDFLTLASVILVILLNPNCLLRLTTTYNCEEEDGIESDTNRRLWDIGATSIDVAMKACVQYFRLFSTFTPIDKDLDFWMKLKFTTWFLRFILQEYDDVRWIHLFRMTKRAVFTLSQIIKPTLKKKDMRYRLAIPVTVQIACTLFKISHGASLLICNEPFAIGHNTLSIMLREVVHVVNVAFCKDINSPTGASMLSTASAFQELCGHPGVPDAIDGTHIAITKPCFGGANYYYFKLGGYTINCQAIVVSSRQFLDLYVDMAGCTNDSHTLRRSTLESFRSIFQWILSIPTR